MNDELARLQARPAAPGERASSRGDVHRNRGAGARDTSHARTSSVGTRPRQATTANQVRAIVTLARRQHADLAGLLRDAYGVGRPEDLSPSEASQLIDRLGVVGET